MHALWNLPEVFASILDNLEEVEDILRMTRVCRVFWNMAVPAVWENLVYSEERVNVFENFSAEDPGEDMTGKHWVEATTQSRYRLYASFVKTWAVHIQISGDVKLLKDRPLSTFSPNLRELTVHSWVWSTELPDVILGMLGGPLLQKLQISFHKDPSPDLPRLICSLTPKLLSHHSDLQSFHLDGYGHTQGENTELGPILTALPTLHILHLRKVKMSYNEVWEAASQLPKLKKMALLTDQLEENDPLVAPIEAFPSLEMVDLGRLPARLIPFTLTSFNSNTLTKLRLVANGGHTDTLGGGLSQMGRFRGLQALHLLLGGIITEWDDLVPLLSCRSLKDVTWAACGATRYLTNRKLKYLAQAWPHLQEIEIRDSSYNGNDGDLIPSATLNGLLCFAKHCPFLTSLNISVDARDVEPFTLAYIGENVKILQLQLSVAGDEVEPFEVANFIALIWPNQLDFSERNMWENSTNEPQYLLWSRIWDFVDNRLA